jgi:ABC-type dipeptide/oligopeptide/nickel transport system permease component
MSRFILQRFFSLLLVLLGITLLTFIFAKLTPGDPVIILIGKKRATPEMIANLREELGLDDPVYVQYGRYLWNAMRGDLGRSYRGNVPVMNDILERFPYTFQLALAAMLFAVPGGVLFGVVAAFSNGKFIDWVARIVSLLGISIPNYWLAILMIIFFGVQLKWISVAGDTDLKNLFLPAFCLGLPTLSIFSRLTRSSMLEILGTDFIRTARGKGLRERTVIITHALLNALIPVITVAGLEFGGLLGGTLFIESVFARPGLGRFAINAISYRDYPQVQGIVLFTATIYVVINTAVDLLYGVIDPRIRIMEHE